MSTDALGAETPGPTRWDLPKRTRALCEGAGYGAEVACTIGATGDGILNDGRRRLHHGVSVVLGLT
jgi:hypothetical protein